LLQFPSYLFDLSGFTPLNVSTLGAIALEGLAVAVGTEGEGGAVGAGGAVGEAVGTLSEQHFIYIITQFTDNIRINNIPIADISNIDRTDMLLLIMTEILTAHNTPERTRRIIIRSLNVNDFSRTKSFTSDIHDMVRAAMLRLQQVNFSLAKIDRQETRLYRVWLNNSMNSKKLHSTP
jgi:hypothetical protein